jgi:hypothetical protein
MTLSGGILTLIGSLFDFVVKYTIIDMAQNIGNESVGGSIRDAWRALRDIANMFFIFVLLYVAFKAVFDLNFGNVGKAISNIIIVALLINFSLFFSKVVIDASNIAAVGFYNSIITANSRSVSGESAPSSNQTISSGYMRLLGLQSWYSPNILIAPGSITPDKILIVGIFSSVFMLITAVIFLISTVMFAARFIILVFLMILSPLALVAIVIPGMNGYFDKWKDALINQSIFAPIFLALTWVVFKIGSTPGFLGQLGASAAGANAEYIDLITKSPSSSMGLVLNYVLVIGFSIAALVISKQIASKAPFFTAISGGIGAGAIGGAAILGRQTIGRGAKMLAESSKLRDAASAGKWYSGAARAGLWTADKGAGGSFDLRATDTLKKVPGLGKELDILGKAGGKGGFVKAVEQKAEDKAKYAKRVYGQTTFETEKARQLENDYNLAKAKDTERIKETRQKSVDEAKKVADDNERVRKEYLDSKLKPNKEAVDNAKKEEEEKKKKLEEEKKLRGNNAPQVFTLEKEVEAAKEKVKQEEENLKATQKSIEQTDEAYIDLKEIAKESDQELKMATQKLNATINDDEYLEDVKKIGKDWQAKKEAGKRRMIEFADRVEKGSPVSTMVGGLAGGALGAIFGAAGGPVGLVSGAVIGAGAGAGGGNWAGGKLPKRANWVGNTEAGRKIRAAAEGKDKKDPKKAAEQFLKDMGVDTGKDGEGKDEGEDKKKEGGGDKDKKNES